MQPWNTNIKRFPFSELALVFVFVFCLFFGINLETKSKIYFSFWIFFFLTTLKWILSMYFEYECVYMCFMIQRSFCFSYMENIYRILIKQKHLRIYFILLISKTDINKIFGALSLKENIIQTECGYLCMCTFVYMVLHGWENRIQNSLVLIHVLVIRLENFNYISRMNK